MRAPSDVRVKPRDAFSKGILGMITSAEHVFYTALATAAAAVSSPSEFSSSLDQLRTLHGKLVNWAGHCPQLRSQGIARRRRDRKAGAEAWRGVHSLPGRDRRGERDQFIQDEALAHELRARFLLGGSEPAFAAVHIRLARDRYRQWGATVKVSALEREFPECFRSASTAPRLGVSLDEMALIKASQAISMETTPTRLFEQILRVVVEVTGAQKGALVLPVEGALRVRARIEAADEVFVSLAETPLEQCIDLPSAILRYVMRTKASLLLSDARTSSLFAGDRVVQQRKLQSVLCIPLVKQSTVLGLIYLENNAMAGAFADDLAEIGQVLASQAVISLQNSTLLEELQQLTGALEARVANRTRQLTDQIAARDKAEVALREADQQKDEFLAMLAHELRNPLASISNASELLTRTVTHAPLTDRPLGVLKRQTKQLVRLVDDLLDLSRIARGQITLEEAPR